MALLMPDVNLRRKRRSFENFWQRALRGDNNDSTNSEHIQVQSTKNVSSWRRERPLQEIKEDEKPTTAAREREEPEHAATEKKTMPAESDPPPSKTKKRATVVVATPPTSRSNAPPRSRTRYVQRVKGPTLAHVLDLIRRNEGNVTELDFSNLSSRNKRLEPYGGVLVARVLTTNHTVKKLIIRDHAIGDRGAVAIANMLRVNTTLEFVDLYSNEITDVGAEALAKALYGHESLQHLTMWSNAISNRGAQAFADALKCNSSLKYLGLVHNRITSEGAQALLDALEVNTHLETLNLATNRVPHKITAQIRISLARNRVEAPRVLTTMRKAEAEVRQRLDQLRLRDDEVDESEASGFLSCSDEEDDDGDENGVWI